MSLKIVSSFETREKPLRITCVFAHRYENISQAFYFLIICVLNCRCPKKSTVCLRKI